MPEKRLQDYLFQQVKEKLSPGTSVADVVSELLHISQDSAYRRLRGETPLILEEAKLLCRHFSISLDVLFGLEHNSVVFQNVDADSKTKDFKSYLQSILVHLKQLNDFSSKTIYYLTTDLPLFYVFMYPPLFWFRYHSWMKYIMKHPDWQRYKFSLDNFPPEIEDLGKEIAAAYCNIASVEIWTTTIINNFLQQVNDCRSFDLINEEQQDMIHQSLHQLISHLRKQAESGKKFLPEETSSIKKDNFVLYCSRTPSADNNIIVQHDDSKIVYLNYDAMNYLTTSDAGFCNRMFEKMEAVIKRSTLITKVGEKQRNIFFNQVAGKIPVHTKAQSNILQ